MSNATTRLELHSRASHFSVGLLVMTFAAHPALAMQQDMQAVGTIQVTGQAQVSVPPDMVRIAFAVETEGRSAGEASTHNASTMDAVVSALRDSPVEGLTIETYGYDLQPVYGRATGAQVRRIEGYRALNNIGVSAKEISAAGQLIDVAVGAGANRVASLRFTISDPGPARLQALRQAVAMAREEARTIADAMGVPLGPPLEVQGGSSLPRIQELARTRMEMQAAVSTPIEAGLQTVSASVTIKYRLGSRDR
jgi:uncharacterized protein YggE